MEKDSILENEVDRARREIKTDSYSKAISEILNKIEKKEIILNPKFQRYFRWSVKQQSDLIESVFLNIPIPPIFIFTKDDGKWEVIDGLQRLNTINKFYNNELELYKDSNNKDIEAKYIKNLSKIKFENLSDKLQLIFKNKRIDVVLLLNESSSMAKFDMFNRLNTGGSQLSPQEIRNALIIMENEKFFDWLDELKNDEFFKKLLTDNLSTDKLEKRTDLDLIIRFLSLIEINGDSNKINSIKSVNIFLDKMAFDIADNKNYDLKGNENKFKKTFKFLYDVFGENAFKRYNTSKEKFEGGFNFACYEFLVSGIVLYIDNWNDFTSEKIKSNLKKEVIEFYKSNEDFRKYGRGGISVETRFKKLINLSKGFFMKYNKF